MVPLGARAVALVPFPFSDLSGSKFRPVLVLAESGRGDFVLCQVTSNQYGDPLAIELDEDDFAEGSLHRTSYVRPGKLFTAHERLVRARVGTLTQRSHDRVVDHIVALLRGSDPPRSA